MESLLERGAVLNAHLVVDVFAERVDADGERRLGGQHARHLALVLGAALADQTGVVDEAVLGSVVFGLHGAEERLLGTEYLHGRRRMLGQVEQRAGVRNETRAHQFAHQRRQVGRNRQHAILQILVQLIAIVRYLEHLFVIIMKISFFKEENTFFFICFFY